MENFLTEISNDSMFELLCTRATIQMAIGRMECQDKTPNAMIAYKKVQLSAIETEIKSRFESKAFVAKLESVNSEIHYCEMYEMLETIEDAERELKYMLTTKMGTYQSLMGRAELDTKQQITAHLNKTYKAYLKYTK